MLLHLLHLHLSAADLISYIELCRTLEINLGGNKL
jgi:hypothetical protein